MTWTKTPPTEPGWYFFRETRDDEPYLGETRIIEVWRGGGGGLRCCEIGDGASEWMSDYVGGDFWSARIEPPDSSRQRALAGLVDAVREWSRDGEAWYVPITSDAKTIGEWLDDLHATEPPAT